jgi:type II secretory pathway component PulM
MDAMPHDHPLRIARAAAARIQYATRDAKRLSAQDAHNLACEADDIIRALREAAREAGLEF